MAPSEELQRKLELVVQTGLLLAKHSDLQVIVQVATDAGLQLCGAQFGAFFYNVINAAGESYLLYTLSGVDREKFANFPMPRNTAVFAPTFNGEGIVGSDDITQDILYGHNAPHFGKPKRHRVSHLAKQTLGLYRENASPVQTTLADLVNEAIVIYERKCKDAGILVHLDLRSSSMLTVRKGEMMQAISQSHCECHLRDALGRHALHRDGRFRRHE